MTEADARTIEERVTALEGLLAPEVPDWSEEQVAEFEKRFAELVRQPARLVEYVRPLGADEIRRLLQACITTVRPGETLAIRAPDRWTPNQVDEYQRYLDYFTETGDVPFKVFVVAGEEFAVITQSAMLNEARATLSGPRHPTPRGLRHSSSAFHSNRSPSGTLPASMPLR